MLGFLQFYEIKIRVLPIDSMKQQTDVIIVGFGLAGSALAYHLHQLGLKVIVFDNDDGRSSSRVAAGLYNPITGRKMVKTWLADALFPSLYRYYSQFDAVLNEKTIYRPFHSIEEQNEWMARTADEHYAPYIKAVFDSSQSGAFNDPFGGVALAQSGFLHVAAYLEQAKQKLKNKGVQFLLEVFDTNQCSLASERVDYQNISAKYLIFCDGCSSSQNQFFDWLPYKLVKGELLLIEAELDLHEFIINRGVFVIGQGNGRFKVGATYNNQDPTWTKTEEGKLYLEDKLKDLINVDYKVIDHMVGVRPATKDRKPFVGLHPKYNKVGIFNGLGAKGVSLAPYFANQFAQHLVNQSALDNEVNIERYFALFR